LRKVRGAYEGEERKGKGSRAMLGEPLQKGDSLTIPLGGHPVG